MTFWIAAGLLTLAVLAAVVLPILRARATARRATDYDIEVYRDQLKEVERNKTRGLIGAAEAEAAKAEIGRRILEADQRRQKAASEGASASRATVRAAAVLVAVALPAGAVAVYLSEGNPGLDSQPFASRNLPEDAGTRLAGRGSGGQQRQPGGGQPGGGGQGQSLAQAEANLTAKLKKNPDNVDDWVLLGRTRLAMQRYQDAVDAFEQALKRAPDRPQINAFYGEALVMANQGTVVPKAQQAFEKVRAQVPDDPRSRFYLGLAEKQAGNPRAALDIWKKLVADAQPGAPYLEALSQQMARVERELGIEPGTTFAKVKPEAPAAAQGTQTAQGQTGQGQTAQGQTGQPGGASGGGAPAPSREQVEAAQDMSAEDRQQMIRGMVDRLASRLEQNPKDAQGWQRLIRSYGVLGEGEKATQALADGLAAFEGNAAVRQQLKAAAQRQGVAMPQGVSPPQQTASQGNRPSGGGQAGSGQSGGTAGAPTGSQLGQLSQQQRQQMLQQIAKGLSNQLQNNPDNVSGWMRLGQTYMRLGETQNAVDALANAEQRAPNDANVLLAYARALRQQAGTQTKQTVELTRRALEQAPNNPEALWFGAMAELREGDKDKARSMFDKAIRQLPPDTPQTAELRKRADQMLRNN
ncbi:c-type cytochrome biogenesis protein CcmI [Rhodovibrio sodomensis]|uniref:C-type cytochrome biogenesis protein CcmI n=1 Tax=Rhodovibrio sodomensis TaxID=1088 RepID=A0ABS1DJZ9_9PROT|nr:c-type cytochrome biogenesis protein CcmI [Rhodovibrio sodomensis]MBK1670316.1 c-type cytochrome biogenesis protein CcmI [Rhodovibrio sodomensis]